MRTPLYGLILTSSLLAQATFEVASLKRSASTAGPDYNNRIVRFAAGFSATNTTLRKLVSEAWGVQQRMIAGPDWLDRNEYDLDARVGHPATAPELGQMLRTLLSARFHLQQHEEQREMRVYELTVEKTGLRIADSARAKGQTFHGAMADFADFLTVQLTIPAMENPNEPARANGSAIPVLDKTGLTGIYDVNVEMQPEPGTDTFTLWQRALPQRFGLRLTSRRGPVPVLVVSAASEMPEPN